MQVLCGVVAKSANNLLREENQKLKAGEEALQQELAKAKATDAQVEKLRKQVAIPLKKTV